MGKNAAGPGSRLTAKLSAVAAVCLLIRLLSGMAGDGAGVLAAGAGTAIVRFELNGLPSISSPHLTALASELPAAPDAVSQEEPDEPMDETSQEHFTHIQEDTGLQEQDSPQDALPQDGSAPEDTGETAQPSDAVETTITGSGGGYESGASGIYLKNNTDYDIDVEELLSRPLAFSEGCRVLIIHTHGSEAYNPEGDEVYTPTDPSRTEDTTFNVVRVGDELEEILTSAGIQVVHDRELYDYPTYTGSYTRAWDAIEEYLAEYPDIGVVIDLHRDALEAADGTVYKTMAQIDETSCAQIMLVAGTNFSGLSHDNWQDNMSFAIKLQSAMVNEFPTLARPISVSQYRYNQNATPGSLIVEVGSNGNTLQEALTAVRYFGQCLVEVLQDR